MTPASRLALTFAVPMCLAACSNGKEIVSVRLRSIGSCDEVVSRLQQAAIHQMEEQLEQNMECLLTGDCWGGAAEDAAVGGDGEGDGGASDYSETNNQVAGVDEADFVKNDGNYLYIAGQDGLHIIDAWPAPDAHVVGTATVEGTPRRLFVTDDRALVYSSLPLEGEDAIQDEPWGRPRECVYGYGCSFAGDGQPTKITVFDIADRAHPTVEREIWLSGSYVSARRVGSDVHTVVSDPGPVYEGLEYWPQEATTTPHALRAAFASMAARNRRIILDTPASDTLPVIREVRRGPSGPHEVSHAGECGVAYATSLEDGGAITSVVSLDLARVGDMALTSVVSRPGAVYGSAEALYLAVPHRAADGWGWYEGVESEEEVSSIHKFAFAADGVRVSYRGSGIVKGHVLNQFALDEWEGDLRVATTSGFVPDPAVRSTLTVLRDSGAGLTEIGRVDDIAPGEDIRSVRFDGDRGFVVTFKKTDPLFVLDLTPPQAPRVVGELHIPGFSTYMHLLDEDHLLTIGYDAEDQGDFAWFTGVLLQIFDVSDLTDPRLAHKEVIGTRGSSSEALTNHLAFNYHAARDSLALPMTICTGGGTDGTYGETMTFSGLMLYHVTAESGFSLSGQVSHPPGPEIGCSNWWTDASSQVKRSVFLENYVLSISESRVKVNAMEALDVDIAEISLE